jgi:AraC-like DNA-binding protein
MVGEPPLHYLTRWRMQLAGDLLAEDGLSIGEIAERVGYQSESPFSKAFKQHTGMAPGAYRRHTNGRAKGAHQRTQGQAA